MVRTQCKIPHRLATGHAEDLPLLFKTQIARRFKPGDDHYNSWQKFLHVFENFIKTGDQNNRFQGIEQWNPISKSDTNNLHCLEMNSSVWQICPLVNLSKLKQWSKLYE